MLNTEAVIAEVLAALFLSYSIARHRQSSEGIGLLAVIWGLTLFVAIPLTVNAVP